ncbi:hypothetical protein JD969_17000 [Planctomycetota bacterium]|nr:hypothetical protein JD969_17000 [Planctomycetota bacterium]
MSKQYGFSDEWFGWWRFVRRYEKGGHILVYKFRCKKCGEILMYMDWT